MSLKREYPNYNKAILSLIGDEKPQLGSDDNRILSYFLPLRNFKNGFDYFELTRHKNGVVTFNMVTMLGFKTILKTESKICVRDYSVMEWSDLIHQTKVKHFMTEEYQALKNGYVKKKSSGCLGVLVMFIVLVFVFNSANILMLN